MSKEIALPSGATVKLKDPKTLKQGERKKIMLVIGSDENQVKVGLDIVDTILSILIVEWSFDLIIPKVKIGSLDDLSIADYDALADEANKAQEFIWQKFDNDGSVDSPKENSNA